MVDDDIAIQNLFAVKHFEDNSINVDRAELLSLSICSFCDSSNLTVAEVSHDLLDESADVQQGLTTGSTF